MNSKKESRLRRARKTRVRIRQSGAQRLCVNRTPRHIYAQITSSDGSVVLVSASTVEKDLRLQSGGNTAAAAAVGKLLATRAKDAGIQSVAFDRSGYRYHGRIKALADSARQNGLEF